MLPDWITKRVRVSGDDCWLWTGVVAWNGYGSFQNRRGLSRIAHRAVYQTLVGPIPDGLDLDHLCRVRSCVNPSHLDPVTRSENLRRSPLTGKRSENIPCCKRGHEFTPENTMGRKDRPGRRICRLCATERTRAWRLAAIDTTTGEVRDFAADDPA